MLELFPIGDLLPIVKSIPGENFNKNLFFKNARFFPIGVLRRELPPPVSKSVSGEIVMIKHINVHKQNFRTSENIKDKMKRFQF